MMACGRLLAHFSRRSFLKNAISISRQNFFDSARRVFAYRFHATVDFLAPLLMMRPSQLQDAFTMRTYVIGAARWLFLEEYTDDVRCHAPHRQHSISYGFDKIVVASRATNLRAILADILHLDFAKRRFIAVIS